MFKNGKYIGYIYLLTCLPNGKVYIGQTRNEIYDRWSGHKHDAFRREYHTAIEQAIKKYGIDNFKVEEIEKIETDSSEELNNSLNIKEIYYIRKYHSLTHENGYNITPGGDNIAPSMKVKTYCYDINGNLIDIFDSRSDAGKFVGVRGEDISGAILRHGLCRNYYFSNSSVFDYKKPKTYLYKKVIEYDFKGNITNTYENYKDAALDNNQDQGNVLNVCKGNMRSIGGKIYRFEEDSFDKYKLPFKGYKVNMYKENIFIQSFDTIAECAKNIGAFASNISDLLSSEKDNRKTVKGYKIYFADDPNQPDKSKIIIA